MSENNTNTSFVYGVLDTFQLLATRDIATVGRVKGTIHKGDSICIRNYGDEDDEVVISKIIAIEIEKKPVDEATDCFVMLRIEDGTTENIKPGSVVYSDGTPDEDIRVAYISSIGDSYVGRRDLEIYETELSVMSITDCSEAWRIFVKFHEKKEGAFTEEEVADFRRKVGIVASAMAKKILVADEIYTVINKITGEPHMFSKTIAHGDDYICAPPEIQIFSKPYKDIAKDYFPADKFEIRKIENGENNNGIKNFLTDAIYLNGAMGVRVNYEMVAVAGQSFFKNPYDPTVEGNERIVTNPLMLRWMLLRSQIGTPKTEQEQLVARLYFRFFAYELMKARLLIPMQDMNNNSGETPTAEGEQKLKFPIAVGSKGNRNMVYLYTDTKRFQMNNGPEWQGYIQTVESVIDKFDCGINPIKNFGGSYYLTKDVYDNIKRMITEETERMKNLQQNAEKKKAEAKTSDDSDKNK